MLSIMQYCSELALQEQVQVNLLKRACSHKQRPVIVNMSCTQALMHLLQPYQPDLQDRDACGMRIVGDRLA